MTLEGLGSKPLLELQVLEEGYKLERFNFIGVTEASPHKRNMFERDRLSNVYAMKFPNDSVWEDTKFACPMYSRLFITGREYRKMFEKR